MAEALPTDPRQDNGVARRLTTFMVLGFLALLAAGVAAGWLTWRTQVHSAWVAHTYQVENTILDVRRLIEQGETTRRGYLLVPEDPRFLSVYRQTARDLPRRFARLHALTRDNPRQARNIAALAARLDALVARRNRTMALVESGERTGALALFRADIESSQMQGIRDVMDAMVREERRLLATRDADLRDGVIAFYVILAVAGLLLLALAVTSLLTILSYTRDIARSRDALASLNATLEDAVVERTADLTRANEEIQRFAYIVSHDLRSPLVNVMGFTAELEAATGQLAELVDRAEVEAPAILSDDARLAAREDLPEAIGFIRTSTQKMDRLINAILNLSRQGRRVLSPEPIDMAALVDTIRGTLAHRLSDADATLETQGTLPVIVTDRFSIDQILSNLIENAVKYLKPGVPGRIVVRGRREGARVHFEVSDNGRGIDPRDHARVFDLFRRSGVQDQPGEGIGLATVRALVFRLGGVIDVTSTLGQGATFRLSLPLTLEPQDRSE
jgi:signal transduction histidine kinase